jgi:hypothetical protein
VSKPELNKELLEIICKPNIELTGKTACMFISKVTHLMRPADSVVDPQEIWNASPSGELDHVFVLWSMCRDWLKENQISNQDTEEIKAILTRKTNVLESGSPNHP